MARLSAHGSTSTRYYDPGPASEPDLSAGWEPPVVAGDLCDCCQRSHETVVVRVDGATWALCHGCQKDIRRLTA